MSRKWILGVLAAYLGIAVAAAVVVLLATPGMAEWPPSRITGSFAGIALLAPALVGLPALILWAFGRFRAERAALPLMTWGFLGALLLYASTAEDFYEGKLALTNVPANFDAFFTSDYER